MFWRRQPRAAQIFVGAASPTPRDRRNGSYILDRQRQRRRSRDDTTFRHRPTETLLADRERKSRNLGFLRIFGDFLCEQKVTRRRQDQPIHPQPRAKTGHREHRPPTEIPKKAPKRAKRPRLLPGTFPHLYKYHFSPRWRLSWRMSVPMNGRIVYSPSMRE